jgi:hypothetical protein
MELEGLGKVFVEKGTHARQPRPKRKRKPGISEVDNSRNPEFAGIKILRTKALLLAALRVWELKRRLTS